MVLSPGKAVAEALERPKSLRDLAATRLRTAIIDAEFGFGELLSESVLGETFGISKTPVHEALVQLQAEGLVEILPQRGARVFQPTSESVQDICDHRVLLETHAARLAYERNRSRLIKGLRAVVGDMRRAWAARDVREYLRLDTAYHDLFYQLSGSTCLVAAYGLIAARAAAIRTQIVAPKPESRKMAFDEHRAIPGLLDQGEIEQVVGILTLHVSRLKDLFQDGPDVRVERAANQ